MSALRLIKYPAKISKSLNFLFLNQVFLKFTLKIIDNLLFVGYSLIEVLNLFFFRLYLLFYLLVLLLFHRTNDNLFLFIKMRSDLIEVIFENSLHTVQYTSYFFRHWYTKRPFKFFFHCINCCFCVQLRWTSESILDF